MAAAGRGAAVVGRTARGVAELRRVAVDPSWSSAELSDALRAEGLPNRYGRKKAFRKVFAACRLRTKERKVALLRDLREGPFDRAGPPAPLKYARVDAAHAGRSVTNPALVRRDASDRPLCRWCGVPCPSGRMSWCPRVACVHRHLLSTQPGYARACVEKRDGGVCATCCADDAPFDVDHIVALIDGGSNGLDNLQTLCRPCHKRKTANDAKIHAPARRRLRKKAAAARIDDTSDDDNDLACTPVVIQKKKRPMSSPPLIVEDDDDDVDCKPRRRPLDLTGPPDDRDDDLDACEKRQLK